MKKTTQLLFLLLGVAGVLMAIPPPLGVPELDPGSGVAALALISGALLVIRARRKG